MPSVRSEGARWPRRLRNGLRDFFKPVEKSGRALLQLAMGAILFVPRRALSLPAAPKILVVRLDRRVGNLLLLTPFLRSLKATLPAAEITVLCHRAVGGVLAQNPSVDRWELYEKWRLFRGTGPLALIARLRARRFDLAFDAGSFQGATVTHPLITRLSGARYLVGPRRFPLAHVYHAAVAMLPLEAHEIDQRLQLLQALPAPTLIREMSFMPGPALDRAGATHAEFLRHAAPHGLAQTVVVVVGSRLAERRLGAEEWAEIVHAVRARGLAVTLLWGPGERALAEAVQHVCPEAVLAPSSDLEQAACLFHHAAGVIGHDTGTSHLAAAVGAALFVIFVATDPRRYGHSGPRQHYIDVSGSAARGRDIAPALEAWLSVICPVVQAPAI